MSWLDSAKNEYYIILKSLLCSGEILKGDHFDQTESKRHRACVFTRVLPEAVNCSIRILKGSPPDIRSGNSIPDDVPVEHEQSMTRAALAIRKIRENLLTTTEKEFWI
jgi:hypothetical protein